MGNTERISEREPIGKASLFLLVALLFTFPCPSFFLFCLGVLPVSGLGLVLVRFVLDSLKDPIAVVFVIAATLHIVLYAAGLHWLARFAPRRLLLRQGGARWTGLLVALLALAVLPIYFFDCMDGHASTRCNAYRLHLGWFGLLEPCGDFRASSGVQ